MICEEPSRPRCRWWVGCTEVAGVVIIRTGFILGSYRRRIAIEVAVAEVGLELELQLEFEV